MVAPSFVTVIAFCDLVGSPILYRILSIPLGPRVVLTKSATAMAPTNDYYSNLVNTKNYQTNIIWIINCNRVPLLIIDS